MLKQLLRTTSLTEENKMNNMKTISDKIVITAELKLLTGMHIGKSNDFAPIGAVDSVVVTDPLSKEPIIPGSTLKGKLRTMLAKLETEDPSLKRHDEDSYLIKRLFGASKPEVVEARLQFYDIFLNNAEELKNKETDLTFTEIKFENTINRITAVADPRQLERVPAGAIFGFKLIYNCEDETDLQEDFENLAKAIKLLQLDYIGGSGTRGYGKVTFSGFKVEAKHLTDKVIDVSEVEAILKDCENYAV